MISLEWWLAPFEIASYIYKWAIPRLDSQFENISASVESHDTLWHSVHVEITFEQILFPGRYVLRIVKLAHNIDTVTIL